LRHQQQLFFLVALAVQQQVQLLVQMLPVIMAIQQLLVVLALQAEMVAMVFFLQNQY
jgi:hypothetical protein